MKSIKTKLVISFSLLVLLSSLALGIVSLMRASEALTAEAEQALASLALEAGRITESRVETQMMSLELLALNEDMQTMDWELQQPLMQKQVAITNFLDIGVVQPDGTVYYSNGSTSQLGDRSYVQKALSGESNVSDPLLSRVTNEMVLMYATPIERDGQVVGALIGRRDGNALSLIADDTGYGQSGYGYVINSQGTVIGHPDRDKVINQFNPLKDVENDPSLTSLANLFNTIIEERQGVSSYSFNNQDLYAGYAPIAGTDWIFVITATKDEVLSAIPTLQKDIILAGGIILLATIAFVLFMGNSIARPIVKVATHSEHIANLDVTQDMPEAFLTRKDEIGTLARGIQIVTQNLREFVGEVKGSSEQVATVSAELTSAAQQSAHASEGVSKAISEIANGAAEQAVNMEEGSTKAFLLGQAIEKDQEFMEALTSASQKVNHIVDEGLEEIHNLARITEESNQASQDIHDVILKTNDSSQKIEEASSVIASIADQTNLLALNAAIEAARAGEAGRGFSVVAEEIRKLAEQSSASTRSIDQMVKELQQNSQSAVKTMEKVSLIAEQQEKSVHACQDKYQLIAKYMSEAIATVEQLNISSSEMNKLKEEILAALENLASIAEENSAAAEEVTASTEEQTATIEEIASSSESLSNLAQNLKTLIMKFKV